MAASADRIWDLVSDVTRIGEFSPETFEAQWLDGADGPRAGARFRGHVRRNGRGPVYWTTCTVTAAEPGREFAFSVAGLGGATANTWRYSLEPGSRPWWNGNRSRTGAAASAPRPGPAAAPRRSGVTVGEDRPFGIMSLEAAGGAGQRVVDGLFGARAAEGGPGRLDVAGKPAGLFRAGGEVAAGCGTPQAGGGGAEDLQAAG
jgi:hypothetical protein